MTSAALTRAVARATGESKRELRRRGFSLVRFEEPNFDPEPDLKDPEIVDWDALDAERRSNAC